MAVREISLTREARPARRGHLARAWTRLLRKKLAIACLITIVGLYSAGIFAPLLERYVTGYSYLEQDYTVIRQSPSRQHWAGTDRAGRDVLTRILWGIQNTVIITLVVTFTGGLVLGVALGLIAGYVGGWVDTVINRVGEIFSSFPDILLMIILAATLRPRIQDAVLWIEDHTFLDGLVRTGVADYVVVSLALVSFGWFGMARLVRGQILYLKETQYVEAARSLGASTPRILFNHLLPNAISPIVVMVSSGMGALVYAEIILSWLGLGIQPPRPSLGRMLLEAGSLGALRNEWWMLVMPSIVAFLLIATWSLLGDALNDVLNPRTR